MGNQKTVTEKTPALHMDKTPFDYEKQKGKLCSRSSLIWILAAILIILFIVVSILFLYPSFEQKILISEEPIEVRMFPSKTEKTTERNKLGIDINPWDFEFLINPVNLCATINPPNSAEYERHPEIKLLILVPSAVDHFEQRKAIRNTWGSVVKRPLGPMRLGFVLGTTVNKTIDSLVHEESSRFGDVIQIDFVDSYQQMTTKSILMLKWMAKMCPHAQYLLKVEDDTFVNVRMIGDILSNEPYVSEDRFIAGHIKNKETSPRLLERFQELLLTMDDYPMVDFPPFAATSYVMSIPTALDLFDASKEVEPFFPVEDAFLTGMCAKHREVPLIHEPTFVIDDPPMPPAWNAYSTLATAHSVTPDILEKVWTDMSQSITNTMFYFETAINATGKV